MRPKTKLSVLVMVIAFIAVGNSSAADIADQPGQVVFSSLRPGNWDIFYFPAPGGAPRRLTDHPGLDYEATFSADGRWVVFTSERRGNPDLYVIDLHGGGSARLLINNDAMEDQAAISPGGKTIAFMSTQSGNADIYTMPFDPTTTLNFDQAYFGAPIGPDTHESVKLLADVVMPAPNTN